MTRSRVVAPAAPAREPQSDKRPRLVWVCRLPSLLKMPFFMDYVDFCCSWGCIQAFKVLYLCRLLHTHYARPKVTRTLYLSMLCLSHIAHLKL